MTRSLKVGIVGYGFATRVFHAPLVQSVPGLELVAVASSDPAKVRAGLPGVAVDPRPENLFARPDIDLVIIPTPNASHHPLAAPTVDPDLEHRLLPGPVAERMHRAAGRPRTACPHATPHLSSVRRLHPSSPPMVAAPPGAG